MTADFHSYGFHFSDSVLRPHPVSAQVWHQDVEEPFSHVCRQNYWVLDYPADGANMEFRVDELPWQSRLPARAHLYPPGKTYMERGPSGRTGGAFFLFSGENNTLRSLVNNSAGFAEILDPEHVLLNCIRQGARAAAESTRGYWQFCRTFADAMEALERLEPYGLEDWRFLYSSAGHRVLSLAERTLEFLEQHYRENISISQLAQHFRCSASTLTHKFRETYSESIWERLLKIRIEQSMLLLNQGRTLKEIAAETGFSTEFYYSRIFRKLTGFSPGAYRKQKI